MKLDNFIKTTHAEINKFNEWYLKEHEKDPEHFPLTMNEGDWYDQFLIWNGMQ